MIDQLQQMTLEIEDLRAALTEAQNKLFEAGKLAGQQAAAVTEALHHLEQAHQSLHLGMARQALHDIVSAMAALA